MDTQRIANDLLQVMTQTALAEAVGVSQPTVSRWSNGERLDVDYEVGLKMTRLWVRKRSQIIAAKRAA